MYDKARTGALSGCRIFGLALKSEIIVQGRMDKPSAQAVMEAAGISRTHAYDIIATGEGFGLLEGLDPVTVEKLRPKAAA
jgi:hypothetical protein